MIKSFQTDLKSKMIWSIASKEIIDLLTTTDLKKIQQLSVSIIELTKVSWLDIIKAISDIEREYNRKSH